MSLLPPLLLSCPDLGLEYKNAWESKTVLAESRCGFLLQSCLDSTRRCHPPQPAARSQPSSPLHSALGPTRGHRRRHRVSPATTSCSSQVRQNYHQDSEAAVDSQINLALYASYVFLSMSYYFDRDDVALKNFEPAEKLMKLQNQGGGRIFLQDIRKRERDDWENGLTAMEYALHLEKKNNMNQSLMELHELATDKNDPYLCDFIEMQYLDEQVKSIKELGDHFTNLNRMLPPHTLGNSEIIWY
uniref:Ferritin n=1 Tax=Sus scrofa TaxID=9823 RepID=A0A8D1G2F2_PIG